MTVQTGRPPRRTPRDAPTATACAAGSTRRRPPCSWLVLFVVPLACSSLRMSRVEVAAARAATRGINFPDNYADAVDNRFFVDSVVFTLKYTVLATVLLIALGLGLALLVQESTRWNGLLRTSFLVPSALGLASASLLFYVLYSPLAGPLAPLHGAAWAGASSARPNAALASTLFLIVWRYAGFYMLLMLVGLQAHPGDVYEAARIDGANRWQTFRQITLPLLQAHRSR